jgi:hypothetical protein
MYPSSFFRFKKLIEHPEIQNNNNNVSINVIKNQMNAENNDYDNSSITNNVEEFKSLFRTQEKLCYELRSENAVLKTKLEMATELNTLQYKKIKKLKCKKDKLKIEKALYEKICHHSGNYSYNNNNNNNNEPNKKYIKNEDEMKQYTYPPPPPPPLPLPPPPPANTQLIQNKKKMDGNPLMNSVLDELKSRIKKME